MTELETTIIQINEEVLSKISELDTSKVYVFEFNVGNTTKDNVMSLCNNLKRCTDQYNIKAIFIPTRDDTKIKISELVKYMKEELKDEKVSKDN